MASHDVVYQKIAGAHAPRNVVSVWPTAKSRLESFPFTKEARVSRSVFVELNLPGDLGRLHMPAALHARLQDLLDRQDRDGKISARERREALALTELADLLTLMKLRARRASPPKR